MTAGDLLRGTLRLLWYALRLPALTFLVILEPIVRFFLGAGQERSSSYAKSLP
jgi:hypothetical protein